MNCVQITEAFGLSGSGFVRSHCTSLRCPLQLKRVLGFSSAHGMMSTDIDLYLKYLKRHLIELKLNGSNTSYRINIEKYTMPFYDAKWALALALNASIERILPATLADYGLGQPQTTEIVSTGPVR